MKADEYYQAGNLKEAIAAALDDVKRNPTDSGKRGFLCELLCLVGDLERADKQLDALGQQDTHAMVAIGQFRQILRAEQARQQFYTDGRLPEFLNQEITPDLAQHLEAAVLLQEKKPTEVAERLAKAEEQRPKLSGTCNGQPFDDLRDLNDMTSSFFEVLTSTGKYFWIPLDRVELVEFRPPERPRDLLWRPVHMIVRNGPDGEVYLPVLYAGSAGETDDQIRMGRTTDWRGEAGAPVRGFGQRMFLVGSEAVPIMEMQTLTIGS